MNQTRLCRRINGNPIFRMRLKTLCSTTSPSLNPVSTPRDRLLTQCQSVRDVVSFFEELESGQEVKRVNIKGGNSMQAMEFVYGINNSIKKKPVVNLMAYVVL